MCLMFRCPTPGTFPAVALAEFQTQINEAREVLVDQATGKLIGAAEAAIGSLVGLLEFNSRWEHLHSETRIYLQSIGAPNSSSTSGRSAELGGNQRAKLSHDQEQENARIKVQ